MPTDISETDLALIELAAISIGSLVIGDQKKQYGIDQYLSHTSNHFRKKGNDKAAALIELVRRKTTDFSTDPSITSAFLERKKQPE